MIRRTGWASYGYLAFAIIMLLLTWETHISNAAVADSGIPEDAIRIRIIANSDTIADQTVKRVIRDQVSQELATWITDPSDIEGARKEIAGHLNEIGALVGNALQERGFAYGYRVEFGQTAFPEKMFGSRLYPAADYEAVKVTLGAGKGKNWWCVLFPPLCFADAVAKKKAQPEAEAAVSSGKEKTEKADKAAGTKAGKGAGETAGKAVKSAGKTVAKSSSDHKLAAGTDAGGTALAQDEDAEKKPEVRFFLIDLLIRLIHWIKSLFG